MLMLGTTEAVLVGLAFIGAILLRFGSDADLVLLYEHGATKIALVIAIFLLCTWHLDLYDSHVLTSYFLLIPRLLQVVGIMSIVLAFAYHIYPQVQLGRRVILLGVILVVLLVPSGRQIFFSLVRRFNLVQRAVVLGGGPLARALNREASRRPELGIEFVGYIDGIDQYVHDLRYLGALSRLPDVVHRNGVSRVVVALQDRRGRLPLDELLQLKCQGVMVQDGIDFYESVTGKLPLDSVRLSSLIFSQEFRPSRVHLLFKRGFSICLAAVGLIVCLPLMFAAAMAIRLDCSGPVIFRQLRLGKDGKAFTFYKLRTMHPNSDRGGNSRPAQKVDSRITRVGRWLRRTRLDELPQLFNILRGDMDFVGPRPFVPDQEAECLERIPLYRHRWSVKPGATGWAQVNRGYCATLEDNADKLAYDLFYIKNMSIPLDLMICLKTFKILLLGRGGR
jgi:sugar transferase (PEP-CTERM system associated)